MSNVVMLLQIEHRNMARLLDVIEQQASNLDRHDPVNARLLDSAFEYLSSYPDRCHHPKEDLVYRKLLSRHPEMAKSLENLVREHETLAHATRDVTRAVRAPQPAPSSASGGLATQVLEFVELYRRHMLMEDRYFFPLALQRLSQDDLAEIDFTLFDRPDPLLDPESEARFAELREEIMRSGLAEASRSQHREEAALLSAMRDMAAFNETMQRSGEALRLVGTAGEGYELEHKGNVLVRIPACSESQAAWCAYFYWKGAARRDPAS